MVRFSCFNGHMYGHKPKKSAHPPVEAVSEFQGSSEFQASENAMSPNSLLSELHGDGEMNKIVDKVADSLSIGRGWKSEEMGSKVDNMEIDTRDLNTGHLKKIQSLASNLHGFSFDHCSRSVTEDVSDELGFMPFGEYRKNGPFDTCQVPNHNKKSIFSIGDSQSTEKGVLENSEAQYCGENAGDSGDHTPHTSPELVRPQSMPNIGGWSPKSGEHPKEHLGLRTKSSGDLFDLSTSQIGPSIPELKDQFSPQEERDVNVCKGKNIIYEDAVGNDYHDYDYAGSAQGGITPIFDENFLKPHRGESSSQQQYDLPNKDFKTKRIEEWVTDLQPCSPSEEVEEPYRPNDQNKREYPVLNGLTTAKVEPKVSLGNEAAKRYISSLSASATTAQLANHGLVVIPFLSAFTSLKMLNLLGNNIVRIIAGALPRGLHMLNLSKNQISTIEGLRELTRLRVLDLSYNRIVRIGHGLASCSSLKELYLSGNKISEVEGLHRLLKLNVLDLRANKISTAKCLGQLAANYNSLQAVSLEGNPAQKNVGDDQLKKYLQGLLPHLAYYNRQLIKVGTLKDAADRSVRLGASSHQFDRSGLRSEHKSTRKGGYGLVSKPSSGRRSQAPVSPKHSKGKHARLPPSGTKGATHHQHYNLDFSDKLRNMKQDLAIRRSRSEGTLGVL
ncbi:uncharacterized protein LOC115679861 isoform X1 [Syzygium oleosum]|uniref:uncharacterized protein LOC115679861 isoform X1 n=1 Tax=Syzygium oleosum TaxID=219896 RepID=UPI0011D21267|nr:uncharacterized protein LOC115679861 isoform X1 [Syzygium oleosum]XP_056171200.1 uncharacterized protein LOC115679861 isoform X1 [Syzygium oleosum]XP_056171201.1 uncharacterized protein LOC115679861 isoform X1 [Syzygium oleosum]